MPFNNDDESGIVYVWIGSKSDPEEARLVEEIAEEMFNNVMQLYIHFDRRIFEKIFNSIYFSSPAMDQSASIERGRRTRQLLLGRNRR